uniref:hypothetical protein n=1 Tax=Andreprevotia chitinilytica TaxID=396808 RepID=UPI001FE14849|nr:hypothetical protein [Andreprevotia chitinilytica]
MCKLELVKALGLGNPSIRIGVAVQMQLDNSRRIVSYEHWVSRCTLFMVRQTIFTNWRCALKDLTMEEVNDVSGGIPWTTPALVALADTGSLGPLVWAFGIGYGIGTLAYNYFSS